MVAIGKKNNVFSRVEELGIPKKEVGEGRAAGGRRAERRGWVFWSWLQKPVHPHCSHDPYRPCT